MMGHLDLALPLDIDRVRLSCGDDRALDPCNTHAPCRTARAHTVQVGSRRKRDRPTWRGCKWDLITHAHGRPGPAAPLRCQRLSPRWTAALREWTRRSTGQGSSVRRMPHPGRSRRRAMPITHAPPPKRSRGAGGRRRRDRLCRASRDADAQARLAAAEAGVRARGRQPAVHAAGSGRRRRDAPRVQAQVRPAMRALARGRSGRGALVH